MPDDREWWYLPSPAGWGTVVMHAHARGSCKGACPLHAPSAHWARDMPLRWVRHDWGWVMWRECPHGVIHFDPDDAAFRGSTPGDANCGCGCGCPCPYRL